MTITTICFADRDSGDDAVVVVRTVEEMVGVALSLRTNGDVEVFFGAEELDQLVDALQTARRSMPTQS